MGGAMLFVRSRHELLRIKQSMCGFERATWRGVVLRQPAHSAGNVDDVAELARVACTQRWRTDRCNRTRAGARAPTSRGNVERGLRGSAGRCDGRGRRGKAEVGEDAGGRIGIGDERQDAESIATPRTLGDIRSEHPLEERGPVEPPSEYASRRLEGRANSQHTPHAPHQDPQRSRCQENGSPAHDRSLRDAVVHAGRKAARGIRTRHGIFVDCVHGVFSSAHALRRRVVPGPPEIPDADTTKRPPASVLARGSRPSEPPSGCSDRMSPSVLGCGDRLRVLAFITDPDATTRILAHLRVCRCRRCRSARR
jgi:hypothetical protein